ncbi:MAG: PrsW family glutamic-type intramembrane protease, partial [Patescibacteria group bacterium]
LIILSVAPGLIWLFYYLKKDSHPESNRMIITVFLLGMVVAPVAAFVECLPITAGEGGKLSCSLSSLFSTIFPQPLGSLFYFLLTVAFIEELVKYLVVKFRVLKHHELDEPLDVLLYMIIAALGFATVENIFIFFSPDIFNYTSQETFFLAVFRFFTATFLHALCSGVLGFFMALSFCETKHKKILFYTGFALAVLLHGLYNFSIMELGGALKIAIPSIILAGLAIFIYFGIKKLKKLKSICKI